MINYREFFQILNIEKKFIVIDKFWILFCEFFQIFILKIKLESVKFYKISYLKYMEQSVLPKASKGLSELLQKI